MTTAQSAKPTIHSPSASAEGGDGEADGGGGEAGEAFVLDPDAVRNGWTPDALRAYHAERTAAAAARVFRPRAKPAVANSRYRVFRCWR